MSSGDTETVERITGKPESPATLRLGALRRPRGLPHSEVQTYAALVVAIVLGAGVPLSGFTPLNHLSAVLDIADRPYLVFAMPSLLLAVLALLAAWWFPAAGRPVRSPILAWAIGLSTLGVVLSLVGADGDRVGILYAITGYAAPVCMVWAVRRTSLPKEVLAATFLGTVALLLIRADVRFLQLNGLPTAHNLYLTKFSNQPYDFHYETLGNPDETAAYLLLPLTLAAAWAAAAKSRSARGLLYADTVLVAVTIWLTYVRLASLVAVAVVVISILASRPRLSARLALTGALIVVVLLFLTAGHAWHYIFQAASTGSRASGVVRASSLGRGMRELGHHPLTGAGFGIYENQTAGLPAHSAIVEAAAEAGVFGLIGALLVTVGLAVQARVTVRLSGWRSLRAAAGIAALVYWLHACVAGGAAAGIAFHYVSIWGLSLAVTVGVAGAVEASMAAPAYPRLTRLSPFRRVASASVTASRPAQGRRLLVLPAGMALAGVLVGVYLIAKNDRPATRSTHSAAAFSAPASLRLPAAILEWPMSGLPAGWRRQVRGVRIVRKRGRADVRTSSGAYLYQLAGPVELLPAGDYLAILDGRVITGGLAFGALDNKTGHWISLGGFPAQSRERLMALPFSLREPHQVRLILSNNDSNGQPSQWRLRRVSVIRDPGGPLAAGVAVLGRSNP